MLLIVMRFGQRTVESIICSGDTDRFDPSSRLQVSRKVWRFVRAEWLAAGRVAIIEPAACAHARAHRAAWNRSVGIEGKPGSLQLVRSTAFAPPKKRGSSGYQ